VLLGPAGGRARVAVAAGRLVVGVTGAGPAPCTEVDVEQLGRQFGVRACLLEHAGQCSVAFAEQL
jgi:hypothetical protein